MAVVAAALFDPNLAEVDVELVMDDDKLVHLNGEKSAKRGYRPAGFVHVTARFRQNSPKFAKPAFYDVRPGFVRLETAMNSGGENIENHEADVMSITGILLARITQPDDQPGQAG